MTHNGEIALLQKPVDHQEGKRTSSKNVSTNILYLSSTKLAFLAKGTGAVIYFDLFIYCAGKDVQSKI